ncbi:hypothetical protein BDW62DRAFT_211806 [Aspergillus aurantiobrunneus]
MATSDMEYSVESEIHEFFKKVSTTRSACETYAREHVGGEIVPVAVQGVFSYTVYAGPHGKPVAQFCLKSLELKMETASLARAVYGHYAPRVEFVGQLGEEEEGKEPLYIYVMDRIQGISYLDFILAHSAVIPESSPGFFPWRKNIITDIVKFFARSWNTPQVINQKSRDTLFQKYKDFGSLNIMVDETSCNLVGVIDWAEADVAPFGLNLYSHQSLMNQIHLKNGLSRFDDYIALEKGFWKTFVDEVGGLDNGTISIIQSARIVGLLLSWGFTSRLANMPEPVSIQDDESGAYNMRNLDGLLINPATRLMELV